jgi:hypothetical protein
VTVCSPPLTRCDIVSLPGGKKRTKRSSPVCSLFHVLRVVHSVRCWTARLALLLLSGLAVCTGATRNTCLLASYPTASAFRCYIPSPPLSRRCGLLARPQLHPKYLCCLPTCPLYQHHKTHIARLTALLFSVRYLGGSGRCICFPAFCTTPA